MNISNDGQAYLAKSINATNKQRTVKKKRSNNNSLAVLSANKRNKRPLTGKTLAVTTLSTETFAISDETTCISYSDLDDLCKSAGATVSGQVHSRVYAVVATQSAVLGLTQRVRKAQRNGIPILSVNWVRECIKEQKCIVPLEKHKMNVKGLLAENALVKKLNNEARGITAATVATGSADAIIYEERHVDLGCCCSCHEETTEATDCPWCTECSVNVLKRSGGACNNESTIEQEHSETSASSDDSSQDSSQASSSSSSSQDDSSQTSE